MNKRVYMGLVIKRVSTGGYRVPHLGGRMFSTVSGAQSAIRAYRAQTFVHYRTLPARNARKPQPHYHRGVVGIF